MTVSAQLEASSAVDLIHEASSSGMDLVHEGRESRRVRPGRLLPYDVFLTQGMQSLRVFRKGPFDEFTFFQRREVPTGHRVEYLTRLEPRDDGKERYASYGVVRLRDAVEFPQLDRLRPLWRALRERLNLTWLPSARPYLRTSHAYTSETPNHGVNRIRAKQGSGSFHHEGAEIQFSDLLEVLRDELHGPARVAWIETAFRKAPESLTHRYYLDSKLNVYLVRHHPSEGKQLFTSKLSSERERGLLIYVTTASGRLTPVE